MNPKQLLQKLANEASLFSSLTGGRLRTKPGEFLLSQPAEVRAALSALKAEDLADTMTVFQQAEHRAAYYYSGVPSRRRSGVYCFSAHKSTQ